MTQQDKELLFTDLCSRLPYHVRLKVWLKDGTTEEGALDLEHNYGDVLRDAFYYNKIIDIKPYLRPMSSMTEEEKRELEKIIDGILGYNAKNYFHSEDDYNWNTLYNTHDWLNSHHFDYRGLISKGLALEAPKGMYK